MATSTSISAANLFDVSGIVAVVTGGGSGKLTTGILLYALIKRELTEISTKASVSSWPKH